MVMDAFKIINTIRRIMNIFEIQQTHQNLMRELIPMLFMEMVLFFLPISIAFYWRFGFYHPLKKNHYSQNDVSHWLNGRIFHFIF